MTQNKSLKMAVIGYGFVGSVFHAKMIKATPGMEVAAIVATNPAKAAQARADFPAAKVYESVDAFFDEVGQYDSVSIGTPNDTHVELAVRSLEAGVPVVMDKPAANSAAEARKIVEASERTGVAVSSFQNRREDAEIVTTAKYLRELDLGRVVRFESRYRFFQPQVADAWREKPTSGATNKGMLFDLGAHVVDQDIQLFGPIEAVYGEVEVLREGAAVPDDFFIAAHHANGVISHLQGTVVSSATLPRIVVQGTEGSFQINDQDPQEDQLKAGMDPSDPAFGVMPRDPHVYYTDVQGVQHAYDALKGYQPVFYERWGAFLRGEGPNPIDLRESVKVLEVLEAALTSSETGTVVRV